MKVSFYTLGCKVNQYESNIMQQAFRNFGYNVVEFGLESDVVVLGSAPDRWIGPRLRRGRLTFRYAERWYKTGLPPAARVRAWLHHGRFQRAPLYLLCAGAYVAADAAWAGCYRDKAYRFGYFPPLKCAGPGELPAGKPPDGGDLLWAGRFLSWKHPLDAIARAGSRRPAVTFA